MPRQVNKRVGDRIDVQQVSTPEAVNVVASQNVVAEKDNLSRVASALGNFMPGFEKYDRAKEQEASILEQNKKVLEGQTYGIDVANEAEKHWNSSWRDAEDAEAQIRRYHEEALAKIEDPDMQKAASKYIMSSMSGTLSALNEKKITEYETQIAEGVNSVFLDQAKKGMLSTSAGLQDAWDYAFVQFGSEKEASAALMKSLINYAEAEGDMSVLSEENLSQIKSKGVPLEDIFKSELTTARARASAQASKKVSEEVAELKATLNTLADSGELDKFKITDEMRDQFTQKEYESLIYKNLKNFMAGSQERMYRAYGDAGKLAFLPDGKVKTDAVNAKVSELKEQATATGQDAVPQIAQYASSNGVTIPEWESLLTNAAVTNVDIDAGVPNENLIAAHELYTQLKANPNLRARHIKNTDSNKTLAAYDFALNNMRMDQTRAQAFAYQVANDPNFTDDVKLSPKYKEIEAATSDLLEDGFWADTKNRGHVHPLISKGAQFYIKLGNDPEQAVELAAADVRSSHRKLRGQWVWTGGKDLPPDLDDILEYGIRTQIPEGRLEELDMKAEDVMFLPHMSGRKGLWSVVDSKYLPLDITFNEESLRKKYMKEEFPSPTLDEMNRATWEAQQAELRKQQERMMGYDDARGNHYFDRTLDTSGDNDMHIPWDQIKKYTGISLWEQALTKPEHLQDKSVKDALDYGMKDISARLGDTWSNLTGQSKKESAYIADRIRKHEGYRLAAYSDAHGKSIGYGTFIGTLEEPVPAVRRMIEDEGYDFTEVFNGTQEISEEFADRLFEYGYGVASADAQKVVKDFRHLPKKARGVLVEMTYQMGMSSVLGFRNFRKALEAGDYETAADEMLDSKWYKEQTPKRAKYLSDIIRNLK